MLCLANCLGKLNTGLLGGEGRGEKGEVLPILSRSRRERWGTIRGCRRPLSLGPLFLRRILNLARSQPWGGATKGGTKGAEGVKIGSRVRNPTPKPPWNPTSLRCLSPLPLFIRCPSYHSNHLLPLVSGNWPGVVHIPFPASWLHP